MLLKTRLRLAWSDARIMDDLLNEIRRLGPDSDYSEVMRWARKLKKQPASVWQGLGAVGKRVAILSGATSDFVAPLLNVMGARRGLKLDTWSSDYAGFETEILQPSQELLEFNPEVIWLETGSHNLQWPKPDVDQTTFDSKVLEQATRFLDLYQKCQAQFTALVVTNNFLEPSNSALGNFGWSHPMSRRNFVKAVNRTLRERLPEGVVVLDVERLSSQCGTRSWYSARNWNTLKVPMSLEALPSYVDSFCAVLAAAFGKSKKCLVLDLDNTLWGGVVGDDGLENLVLAEGSPEGEAYRSFQRYVQELKARGVLLAVCSKNELDIALEPFRSHPDMILKESDLVAFKASWNRKDTAIRELATELNLGLDSFVFFDDNPAERLLVRENIPEVTVVDVPTDVSEYVSALDSLRLFETIGLSNEDSLRTAQYQQNAKRKAAEQNVQDYDEYLKALEMQATCERFTDSNINRVTQLINKTNQFNVTTRRLSIEEVKARKNGVEYFDLAIRLRDKFGDHGLISVLHGKQEGDTFLIENWLMSCRVLKRNVEHLAFEELVQHCKHEGIRRIIGEFIPTAKNKMVENLYADLGFEPLEAQHRWQLDLSKQDQIPHHFISKSYLEGESNGNNATEHAS